MKIDLSLSSAKKFILKISVTAIILWLLLHNINLEKLFVSYRQLQLQILFYATVLIVSGNLVIPAVISMRSLKAGSLAFSLWDLVRVNFAVRFYSLFLPRGLVTGIRWVKYRNKGKGSDAAVLILFEKIIQMAIMIAVCVVFLGLDYKILGRDGQVLFILSILCLLSVLVGLAAFCTPPQFAGKVDVLINYIIKFFPPWLNSKCHELLSSLQGFRNLTKKDVSVIVFLSFAGHALCILGGYVLAEGLCPQINLAAFAWMRSVILFLSLMPLTIGNLGVREAGYMYLMGLYFVPAESAVAFSLGLFTVQILIGFMGGGIEGFYFLFAKEKLAVQLENKD